MRRWLVVLIVGLSACLPKAGVQMLEPALITFPADVRTLAVVDRSAPRNAAQGILGAIEGVLTGEGIMADRAAAERAVQAVVGQLAMSPRFDVVVPVSNARYVDSNVFATMLEWPLAERICRDAGAEALVALEALDSDARVDVRSESRTETVDGRERTYLEWTAVRYADVTTVWRVYDPSRRVLLDNDRQIVWTLSWSSSGRTREAALRGLPPPHQAVADAAFGAGNDYGARIAPHYVIRSRPWFGKGDDSFSEARRLARSGLWEEAATLWRRAFDTSTDPDVRGRAAHNLALHAEIDGRVADARAWLAQAVALHRHGASRRYLSEVEFRLAEERTLDVQMAPVNPSAPPR